MSTKQRLKRSDELLVAPFRCNARGEDGAHAGAADEVDRHAVLAQRAHDAEVGEAARAAAREHEADRPAGQQPHDAVEVGGHPEVVVGDAGERVVPACRRAARDFALMQDQELCVAHAAVGPSCGSPGSIAGGRARREQHDVGLAQAKLSPRRVAGVARIHHEVVLRFALVEPLRAVADRSLPVDEGDAAEARQRAHEPSGLLRHVDAVVQRDQRERAWLDLRPLLRLAVRETGHGNAREPQDRFRVAEQHALESRCGQHRQFRVAQRPHARSSPARDNQAHLADGFAGGDAAESARRPVHRRRGSR